MRLTRFTDYSLRVLIFLGIKQDGLSTIKEIADHYDISKNHLMKVVYELNRLGYIETVRGKNGGMRLNQDPDTINLGALVRRTENDLDLVECFSDGNRCVITPACRLKSILGEALNAFIGVLDQYTLTDLLAEQQALAELLRIEKPVTLNGRRPAPG
ncbi:Rrf2 family transcriptional regulator [Ectothiorhodospiraceae bacterium WFHF3C12]|nr:Rrf2 family transcriptional regulator [Ectothiorhodospiraceae bacterium WFHF3C12]